MKRFNKFLCGEIDLEGNKVIALDEEEVKHGEFQMMQVDQT
jgi:hypothetical protein